MDTVEVNGVRLAYRRAGGDKPPAVLLHGLMGSSAVWTPVARVLSTELEVITPDARGHGDSSAPDGPYRYDDLAADVVGLIGELGLHAPVLVGHSMGGMTAALAATRLGPALRGLVLLDPTFLDPERQDEVYASDVRSQHLQAVDQGRAALLEDSFARHAHRPAELVEAQVDARLRTSASAFDILRPPNPPFRELMTSVDVPTLLVVGDRTVVTAGVAAELAGLNHRVQVRHIDGAGHGVPFDEPDTVARAVLDFTGTLPVPG